MEDLKAIVARNIVTLRRKQDMTQLELAEKLNYTDKAVSKWERGESLPDIIILKAIADLFGVTLDYLVTLEHDDREPDHIWMETEEEISERERKKRRKLLTHAYIACVSVLLVWLVATGVFVIIKLANPTGTALWLAFLYAVPVSMIVWLIFNSIWFNTRKNYLIISLLMWSALISTVISLLAAGFSAWTLFSLGIPGQIIILVWSRLQYKKG